MGRKTFESIGRVLPGRETIVVTRDRAFEPSRCGGQTNSIHVAHGLEAALALAQERAQAMGAEEVILAGGGDLYESLIGNAERMHLTFVDAAPRGAVSFPDASTGRIGWRSAGTRPGPRRKTRRHSPSSILTAATAYRCSPGALLLYGKRGPVRVEALPVKAYFPAHHFQFCASLFIKRNLMPWSSEGGNGGSWKPSGPGPWGSKPGGTTPEFEEFLKRGQEKIKQFMPGSGGSGSTRPARLGSGRNDRLAFVRVLHGRSE